MAFKYETAVPWGRSFEEYQRMFALSETDLNSRLLGCADGPAGFNARAYKEGHVVVSVDPLYQLAKRQIQGRIDATYKDILFQTLQNQEKFLWDVIQSPYELGRRRMAAMNEFLADYDAGTEQGRYVTGELPNLPFTAGSFDLALCSHFLFLYSDNFSLKFHQQAIESMCRVAREARIFPLLNYNSEPSPFLGPLLQNFSAAGYTVRIERVPYEFQRGANQMMRISCSDFDVGTRRSI
jgi:hypothetical protein